MELWEEELPSRQMVLWAEEQKHESRRSEKMVGYPSFFSILLLLREKR